MISAASRPDLGYFWVHTLFGQIVNSEDDAAKIWKTAEKVTAEYGVPGPHRFVPYEKTLVEPATVDMRELIEGQQGEAIYKMTIHDVKYDRNGGDQLLGRDGRSLGSTAVDSAYEYILRRTLEQAR